MQMSGKQWRALDLVERIERGELTIAEAALALGRSHRQMQRIRKRVRSKGAAGVVHGNAGRAPKHKVAELVREQIVALRREKYVGFNDQHFTEKLVEVEGLGVSRETVRRVLRAAGIGAARARRACKHRRRRDRRAQAGQMILWDGSRHDWLEGRGPRLCLMGAIDDATGELLPGAHFVDQESSVGYLGVLRAIVKQKGVPLTAYMDRHSALRRNDDHWTVEEELAGRREPTQVQRALGDLGVQVLYALSPQAKGRVERLWGTLQDRLVSELRLAQACSVQAANAIVERYRNDHNARFAVPAQDAHSAWRDPPPGMEINDVCALQYVRTVLNNNTVRLDGQVLDLPKKRRSYAKAEVIVCHRLSGSYRVYFRGKLIGRAYAAPPVKTVHAARTLVGSAKLKRQLRERILKQGVTESLTS